MMHCAYYKKDFWEYDPATNTWTQKADLGEWQDHDAVGFSHRQQRIYWNGTAVMTACHKKISGNMILLPIPGRRKPTSEEQREWSSRIFHRQQRIYWNRMDGINALQMISGNMILTANTWTQKADFGGTARYSAVGFSIGSKGYIGTGVDGNDSL